MICRALKPEETIRSGDYYQTTYAGEALLPALYSVSMTAAEALEKFPHITAFYRPTDAEKS